jgi:hypothetical protein
LEDAAMHEHALEMRYLPDKTNVAAIVCAAAALFGIYAVASQSGDTVFLLVGSLFIAIGIYGLFDCRQRAGDTSVILRIGPDGILDRRLSPRLIPWQYVLAIEERQTWGDNPTPYLDLILDRRAPIAPGISSCLWRFSGSRGFPVTHNGLEGTFHQIYRAAKHFADQRGVPYETASSVLFN